MPTPTPTPESPVIPVYVNTDDMFLANSIGSRLSARLDLTFTTTPILHVWLKTRAWQIVDYMRDDDQVVFSVDNDWRDETAPILRSTVSDCSVVGSEAKLLVNVDTNTVKFQTVINGKQYVLVTGQFKVFRSGSPYPYMIITVPVRLVNVLDDEGSPTVEPLDPNYYTATQVDVLLSAKVTIPDAAVGDGEIPAFDGDRHKLKGTGRTMADVDDLLDDKVTVPDAAVLDEEIPVFDGDKTKVKGSGRTMAEIIPHGFTGNRTERWIERDGDRALQTVSKRVEYEEGMLQATSTPTAVDLIVFGACTPTPTPTI